VLGAPIKEMGKHYRGAEIINLSHNACRLEVSIRSVGMLFKEIQPPVGTLSRPE